MEISDFVYAFSRWLHLLAGVTWIGLLYYLNFVQGPFMASADGPVKSAIIRGLLPRALWWFRWGAAITWLTGIILLTLFAHKLGGTFFETKRGVVITLAAYIATFMAYNVWFVIWPAQQVVIASAEAVAAGGQANPEAAARAARAACASRHNVFFSIPMFLMMITSAVLPLPGSTILAAKTLMVVYGVVGAAYLAFQVNALVGKTGPLTTVKGVITSGFVMTGVLYGVMFGVLKFL